MELQAPRTLTNLVLLGVVILEVEELDLSLLELELVVPLLFFKPDIFLL